MDYKVLRTKIGLAKFANFPVTQAPIAFKYLAIGDGGGVPVEPNQNQTALVRETARVQINTITKDPNNDAQFIIEAIIPEGVGNFYIREAGVFDEAGDLILIANYPESYKPLMAEGSGKVLRIRLILEESNAAAVTLKIDPSVVLATREYVDLTIKNSIAAHEKVKNPHPEYAQIAHKHGIKDIENFSSEVDKLFSGDENHVYLPNGYLMQFWTVSKGINDQTVQFPVALTAKPVTAPVISLVSGFQNNDSYCVVSWTASSCVLRGRVPAGNGAGGVMSLFLISKIGG